MSWIIATPFANANRALADRHLTADDKYLVHSNYSADLDFLQSQILRCERSNDEANREITMARVSHVSAYWSNLIVGNSKYFRG